MRTALEMLSLCVTSDVKLWEEDGRLRYHGAAPVLAPLLPDLARLKPALLELLAHGDRYATKAGAEAEPLPFAPPEVTNAARARGVAVTSYGWPACYWAGDYADELKAARSRKETH